MKIFTIGFTKKTAEEFFRKLRDAGVRNVVDVRLNNSSQLSGFAKQTDLRYFLREVAGIGYIHLPQLAPTKQMLDDYKKRNGAWEDYEKQFNALMRERRVEETVDASAVAGGCLLCSEDKPHRCHRRLVAEYLRERWRDLRIRHL